MDTVLKLLGWLFIASAVGGAFLQIGNDLNSHTLTSIFQAAIAGIVFLGFGSVITLLLDIRDELRKPRP